MRLPSGSLVELAEDCRVSLCKYFGRVYSDPNWVKRRVETVKLVDLRRIERRVTLDIDAHRLKSLAQGCGFELDANSADPVLPVPLTLLKKGLYLDFDVRDSTGGSLPLVTSDEDSCAAQSIMFDSLSRSGLLSSLTTDMGDLLYSIARSSPSEDDVLALNQPDPEDVNIDAWDLTRFRGNIKSDDDATWKSLFENEQFKRLVATFTLSYLPIIYIDACNPRQLIKYRFVESEFFFSARKWSQRLSVRPSSVIVEAPAFGRAEREHLRLIAPSGINIIDMGVVRVVTAADTAAGFRPRGTNDRYQARVALERGALYASRADKVRHVVVADVQPDSSEFLTPAFFAVAIAAVLLLGGGIYQMLAQVFSDVQSTIALLLTVPSAAAAFLARSGEHRVLSRLLRVPRVLVGITVVGSIASAGTLVAKTALRTPSADKAHTIISWIWIGSGSYATAVALLLGLTAVAVLIRERRAVAKSSVTEDRVFETFRG